MKKYILISIFSLILFYKASACSCSDKPSIEDNWKYASQVFIGEVVAIDNSGNFYSASGQQVTTITIRIIETFKLDIYKNYNYRTFIYLGGGSCDSNFEIDKKYLIYASGNGLNSFLKASICSRTALLSRVDKNEILQLRKLYQDFKAKNKIPQLISDNEIESYELALSKSSNDKLARDKRILVIVVATLTTIIILTLIIYVIIQKKRTTKSAYPKG